jgi:nucleotide-binding universal stress UspA family protein
MKKILCPTDFSDVALSGTAYAAKLAKKIGADLTLFNVVALTDLFPEEVLMGEQANTESAKIRLDAQCREVTRVFKISCYGETETAALSVSQVIAAKASEFDLMVMGTNGVDDLAQFLRGSHSYRAVQKSTKPVILVPEHALYTDISRIVYAYDYWGHGQFPIRQLLSFAEMVGCSITVLLIREQLPNADTDAALQRTQEMIQNLYKDDASLKFETIYTDETIEGLNSYMHQSSADILALCSEHHNFLRNLFHKSVIKSITGMANFPVMVFHS